MEEGNFSLADYFEEDKKLRDLVSAFMLEETERMLKMGYTPEYVFSEQRQKILLDLVEQIYRLGLTFYYRNEHSYIEE